MTEKWKESVNNYVARDTFMTNLSKVFDCCSHNKLSIENLDTSDFDFTSVRLTF